MSDQYVPALRQQVLEDIQIKGLQPKTKPMYLGGMREFTRFLGHAPDSATPEKLQAFQLDMKERGVGAPTFYNRLTGAVALLRGLKCSFKVSSVRKRWGCQTCADQTESIVDHAASTGDHAHLERHMPRHRHRVLKWLDRCAKYIKVRETAFHLGNGGLFGELI